MRCHTGNRCAHYSANFRPPIHIAIQNQIMKYRIAMDLRSAHLTVEEEFESIYGIRLEVHRGGLPGVVTDIPAKFTLYA